MNYKRKPKGADSIEQVIQHFKDIKGKVYEPGVALQEYDVRPRTVTKGGLHPPFLFCEFVKLSLFIQREIR